jgi:hypothetical protein
MLSVEMRREEEVRDAGSGGVQTEVIIMWWRLWRW